MPDKETDDTKLEKSRVEAFSDGVFAIALTLLVLDLHSPDNARGEFGRALLDQWPAYVAFLAAFANISALWINHHDVFRQLAGVTSRLLCVNLLVLLVASLFPWPAAVMSAAFRDGTHDDQVVATVLYAAVGLMVPLVWSVLYYYLARKPELFLEPSTGVAYARRGIRRSLFSVIAYPLGALLASVEPVAAIIAFLLVPSFFIATVVWREDS